MAVTSKSAKVIGHNLLALSSSGTTTVGVSYESTHSWFLKELRFNLSTGQASGSTFTVLLNSGLGAVHDIKILEYELVNISDIHYMPVKPVQLDSGDVLDISWVNNTTNKWGLSLLISRD